MNIHTRLRALILITLLPAAAFGIAGAFVLVKHERDTLADGVRDQVRAISSSVDTELRASIAPLELLAQSPALDRDDLAAFRIEAERALAARHGEWVNLLVSDPQTAEMRLNLRIAPGTPLSTPADPDTIRRVAQSGRPAISNVVMGPILKRPVFGVRVPVVRDGRIRWVLTAIVETAAIDRVLERVGVPASATVAILDSNFRFIARQPAPGAGNDYASDSLKAALSNVAVDDTWQRGSLLDGTPVYRAFRRSGVSHWYTSMAIPSTVVEQGMAGTWLLLAGFVAAGALGLVIAWVLAARLTRPIAALAAAAPALGRGDASALPPESDIDEVRGLARALGDAATAIRDREEKQRLAEQSLRDADRAKDEFLAMLGHELRNPLASVANVSRLLEFAERQPAMLKNVGEILARQVAHMTHLLDDLLEVGRLTGGKITLERTPVDLAAIAQQMLDAWTDARRFAHHPLAAKLAPAWALVDRVRIEQVLSNLLDNALKFTPAGGRIEVVVERRGGCAVLEVSDSGEGIPEALIERMFDLFVQGERNLARQQGGLGIGLTMAKRLVELHDGTIVARSAGAGRGASFTVSLPAIERPEAAMPAAPIAAPAARRILVIEDNPDARESLVALLRECGHEVHAEADGESGVAAATAWTPDVALVDIGLPGIDGYEVARRLRARSGSPSLLLIALTGYGSAEDQRRSLAAGFDAHLIKPLDLPMLDGLLARLAKAA